MTQWEYRQEQVQPRHELALLALLGDEGWELVQMLPVTVTQDLPQLSGRGKIHVQQQKQQLLILMLKRPKKNALTEGIGILEPLASPRGEAA